MDLLDTRIQARKTDSMSVKLWKVCLREHELIEVTHLNPILPSGAWGIKKWEDLAELVNQDVLVLAI